MRTHRGSREVFLTGWIELIHTHHTHCIYGSGFAFVNNNLLKFEMRCLFAKLPYMLTCFHVFHCWEMTFTCMHTHTSHTTFLILALLVSVTSNWNLNWTIICLGQRCSDSGGAMASTVTSQQEGNGFEPTGWLGPVCVEFASYPRASVDFPTIVMIWSDVNLTGSP